MEVRMKKLALPILLVFLSATAILAQNYRGRIEGLITDQSGAVVVGATVTLINVGTNIQTVRQSSGTGMYLFDLLDPGTYTITVELKGFQKFVQENIILQASNDITVNAVLQPGTVTQTIEVTATPSQVQFTSSNQDITLNSTLASETPRYDRNPFKLTLLAPEAINTRTEILPFLSWSANSVDLGGGTNLKNELEVDGSPVGMGHKYSYPPNMDAVESVNVAQNSTDAEFGHSAGGVITTTTKSGTNDWHGSVYYLGRYPWANAIYDRTTMSTSSTRQNMIGGTLGNAIIKNKLFNFGSFEYWKVGNPTSFVYTVPTALEAKGDFTQSYWYLNGASGIRNVYDPYSTVYNPATGLYTRTQFSCNGTLNVICPNRMDPVAVATMAMMWAPNNPGANISGVNNSQLYSIDSWNYYNFSDRVDYNITDKWKMFGRYSGYHTTDIYSNWTPNKSQLYVPTGTVRTAKQLAGDAVWTMNPNTVVDFHASYQRLVDAYDSTPMPAPGWASVWPSNPWYVPLLQSSSNVPVYFPDFTIAGQTFGGRGFYWDQRPLGEDFSAKYSHQFASGFLKAGFQMHHAYGPVYVSNTSIFWFDTANTANTFINPNTGLVGDQWGSFLLGSLNSDTEVIAGPAPNPHTTLYGMWIQYDWRVSRKLTLNLGLRNETEKAWSDPNRTLSRGLDLTAPVPEMYASPPQMPAQAINIVGSNYWKWNGEWQWTSDTNPGMWNAPALALAPRVGMALRLSSTTALRAGYARFVIPTEYNFTSAPVSGFEDVNFLEPPFFGMTQYQFAAPFLSGVPQETISNPFPASNPLLPIQGKSAGGDVGRGGTNLLWYPANLQKAFNDRFNVNFQRQLPGHIVASATYFLNLGHQHYTQQLNGLDPRLEEQYQSALSVTVPNPFYQYLNTVVMPGPYYYEPTLPLSSLLVPYPQYGPLFTLGNCCALEHYNQLQVQVQKPFSRGLNFLFGYVYTREANQINNFNDSTYFLNQFQWQDADQPRHRWNLAGTYELPFGRGHRFGSSMPKALDYAIGGWRITPVLQYVSGDFPRFGEAIVTGNPCISNPTPTHWFNTSVFQPEPPGVYVLRTNPEQYTCLTGPPYWDLDASLAKEFKIFERFTGQLKMTAYNAINNLNRGDPDTGVTSSTFGETLYQGSPGGTFGYQSANQPVNFGRQLEFGFKIFF
jgi:hypothetical protein